MKCIRELIFTTQVRSQLSRFKTPDRNTKRVKDGKMRVTGEYTGQIDQERKRKKFL